MSRRGYTLIEMIVVVTILAIMAGMVAPRLLAIRESGNAKAAESRLLVAIGRARDVARSRGETIVVGLDPQEESVNLSGADETKTDRYSSDQKLNASLKIDSIGPTNEKTEPAKADKGETLAEFYEDGSAMPASAELTLGGRKLTLRVRGDGSVLIGGEEEQNDRWSAGEIEQRT